MGERLNLNHEVHEIAVELLERRRVTLDDLGLHATVEMKQWCKRGRYNSEIRIAFWRGTNFVDVIEDFLIEDGRPAASIDEFRLWLEQSVDGVVEEHRGR